MGRGRSEGVVMLPKGVHRVRAGERTYYYWHPGRGTKTPGERVRLPDDPQSPEFWRAIEAVSGIGRGPTAGTFAHLIRAYRASPEFGSLAEGSRRDYNIYLNRIEGWWGELAVSGVRAVHVLAQRDAMAATPVGANHMLGVLRTLIRWGMPREYRADDPTIGVPKLDVGDGGAKPWPQAAYRHVLTHAPEAIRRAAILGRATGQRIGDLCRMRPTDRDGAGLRVRIGKLRGKEHWCPLDAAAIAEVDGWGVEPMRPYIARPSGLAHTQQTFGATLNRWQATVAGRAAADVSPHGLRALAVCDRRIAGLTHQTIAAQIGMSLPMVMRYSRFIDQREAASPGTVLQAEKAFTSSRAVPGLSRPKG